LDNGCDHGIEFHNLWAVICAGAISWLYIPALIAGVYFDIPVSVLRLQAAKIVMMNVFHIGVELEDYIIAGGD
jgi:hypothetical protein